MAHILLLEPDTLLGNTYRAALEFSGHTVTLCQDAQAAVHNMDIEAPDIIITELSLAVHNGVEFLYELRSYAEWQNIPVVVLSHTPSVHADVMRVLWQELRIAAYHYKPLTKLADLIRSVEQTLVPAL